MFFANFSCRHGDDSEASSEDFSLKFLVSAGVLKPITLLAPIKRDSSKAVTDSGDALSYSWYKKVTGISEEDNLGPAHLPRTSHIL